MPLVVELESDSRSKKFFCISRICYEKLRVVIKKLNKRASDGG